MSGVACATQRRHRRGQQLESKVVVAAAAETVAGTVVSGMGTGTVVCGTGTGTYSWAIKGRSQIEKREPHREKVQ